jgi:glycosyltransferase involved in cell wall biosynthesis
MHIGMVYAEDRPFPPDIRVEKEIAVLCKAGYQVTVLTRRIPDTAPPKESLPVRGAHVIRVSVDEPTEKLVRLWDKLRLLDRAWLEPLARFVDAEKPDALHVHDFLMVPTVLRVAELYSISVIADLHENMPAAMRVYRSASPPLQKLQLGFVYNYRLMRWYEARALRRCAKVIVVVPEAAERLYGYGLTKKQVVVVSNTEDETTFPFHPRQANPQILERYRAYWAAIYIGAMGPHRGLDTTLRAVALIRSAIPNFRLLIVGADNYHRQQIQADVTRLKIQNHVEVIGWQPFALVNSFVMASHVCLVPHNDFEHTHTTVPHKLFQYMICGKPVLVSSCRPLARIVRETEAGLVFEASNSRSLAERLLYMYRHPDDLREMGARGQTAALGPYAWRHDAARLVQMYESLDRTGRQEVK